MLEFAGVWHGLEEAQAEGAVRLVEEMLKAEPGLTGAEVLARLKDAHEVKSAEAARYRAENAPRTSTCRRCGHPIQTLGRDSNIWRHSDGLRAGCRAASFDRLGTWDDSLDRSWKATPTANTV